MSRSRFDAAARDPDKLRDPLGAGSTLAASFGAESRPASGPAGLPCPGGVAAQPLVPSEGPRVSGEPLGGTSEALPVASSAGGRVSPPAKGHQLPSVGARNEHQRAEFSVSSESQEVPMVPRRASISGGPTREAPRTRPRLLTCRVDALTVAAQVSLPQFVESRIERRLAMASEAGAADLPLGRFSFALKRSRLADIMTFENADLRGALVRAGAAGGWNLEVIVRAVFLARHRLEESLALAFDVVSAFGSVHATRLRRFDLAADYIGFPLCDADAGNIVTRANNITTFLEDAKDVDEPYGMLCKPRTQLFRTANRVTGITVGAGGSLVARAYAKLIELQQPGREEKRAMEHELWRAHGWNGSSDVTRVEFQFRGDFLDQAKLRPPENLPGQLDASWQYCAHWVRLAVPGSATRRKRWQTDPRWRAVEDTIFRHRSLPLTRSREARGAAGAAQVLGSSLSFTAAQGALTSVEFGADSDGVPLDERGFVNGMTEHEAATFVREQIGLVVSDATRSAAEAMVRKFGPKRAAMLLAAKINATAARFSSVDDNAQGAA